jgi:hypothetical protein
MREFQVHVGIDKTRHEHTGIEFFQVLGIFYHDIGSFAKIDNPAISYDDAAIPNNRCINRDDPRGGNN